MSYSILLLSDENLSDILLENNFKDLKFEKEKEGVIHHSDNHKDIFISIFFDKKIDECFYEENELNLIYKNFKDPYIHLIDTNNFGKSKTLIRKLPNDLKFLIDNDNGVFISKDEFLKLKTFDDFFHYKETEELS